MADSASVSALRPWLAGLKPRSAWLLGAEADDPVAAMLRAASQSGAETPDRWRPFLHEGDAPPPRPVDLVYAPALGAMPMEAATSRAKSLRQHARFLALVAPTAGKHRWRSEDWRAFQPWALHESAGELTMLCAGGRKAEELPTGPRVWYLAPNQQVFGGLKILYQHVEELNALGVPAALATATADCLPANWFGWNPAAMAFAGSLAERVRPGDTVVIPDVLRQHAPKYARTGRRLLFVQNPALALDLKDWQRLGFDGVLTLAKPSGGTSFLQRDLARRGNLLPTFGIPNHFSGEPWGDVPAPRVPGRILCLPRKGPEFVAALQRAFPGQVETADELRPEEMARAYAAADVYAHTGFPEGLGMPLVESALSGCVACGFSGGGGLDFMEDGRTAFVAADGNAGELVAAVRRALYDSEREAVRRAGTAAARDFDRAAQRAALRECFRGWLPTLPVPQSARRRRGSLFAAARAWLE